VTVATPEDGKSSPGIPLRKCGEMGQAMKVVSPANAFKKIKSRIKLNYGDTVK